MPHPNGGLAEMGDLVVYQPDLEAAPDAPKRIGNWMQTASGKKFWPLDARPEDIQIEDIAASLSKLCRYNGHCRFFYSVAEHSVLVAHHLALIGQPKKIQLLGLMHDATEAYCADVPRPLKPYLVGYDNIEDSLWRVIAQKYGFPPELPPIVHEADNAVLLAEKPILMGTQYKWSIPGTPADVPILGMSPGAAEALFLARYHTLTE